MTRRLVPFLLLALLASTTALPLPAVASDPARAASRRSYRPDAWIKLCGLSTGCTIDPLPHPWRGKNVYNGTGARQKVAVRLDNGEGVRFWLTLQNDGTLGDTFVVQGCEGNPKFVVNTVLVGLYKRPDWRAEKITKDFKAGTAQFEFPPWSEGKTVNLTLNIVSSDNSVGATYRCPITLYAASRPTARDTVLAVMTAY
jgi:hypothetical protein